MAQLGYRSFSTKRIAMFGHSLGGVASIIAAGKDSRIRAVINWDGTIFGSLPSWVLRISTLKTPAWTEALERDYQHGMWMWMTNQERGAAAGAYIISGTQIEF
ncbi:hypothetical protein AC579_4787 [Pseudocercospora musae]|uniref:1-alkyl-2-acetylglycerophosphocholine esterase n=1 Tax=Pseudocercospora musae TaxID=113226 RepID=A0A139I7E9_9PEZI|nr:hypothetical protein AC579_4787 [Pseudocercospora musae]